ncbi:MAG: hypothetical protein K1X67_08935 [Fimbriimonadaceae bacterium]|nr:hypothetical protein [Fimbriimonadaceae bacterium]
MRPRLGWLLGVLALVPALASAQKDEAREVFYRSIRSSGTVNATLIQTKRVSDDNHSTVKFSVMTNSRGASRRTVLQPLSMEGTILIDDGRTWTTIEPEKREAMIQPSPLRDKLDSRVRWRLIQANYNLKGDGEIRVAGRKALAVRALPKDDAMPTRRYTIDIETYVLLRIESASDDGKMDVLMDTLAANFPREMEPSLFEISTEGYKIKRTEYPKPLKEVSSPEAALGFSPRLPTIIPFGFKVTQKHLVGGTDNQFLALRLSDGLSMVTVYQWDSDRRYPDSPFLRSKDGTDAEGISFKVVGDVPRAVRKKLAQAFVEMNGVQKTAYAEGEFSGARVRCSDTAPTIAENRSEGRFRWQVSPPEPPPIPDLPETDRSRGIGVENDPRFDLVMVVRGRRQ